VCERAVGDRFVARPEVPVPQVGADLDVGDRPEARGRAELVSEDVVEGRERPGRTGIGGGDVDEGNRGGGIGPERLAHRREPRLRVRDDHALAGLQAVLHERDGAGEVLVLRLVDERVMTQAGDLHRFTMYL
jgi:hypothetical protein